MVITITDYDSSSEELHLNFTTKFFYEGAQYTLSSKRGKMHTTATSARSIAIARFYHEAITCDLNQLMEGDEDERFH